MIINMETNNNIQPEVTIVVTYGSMKFTRILKNFEYNENLDIQPEYDGDRFIGYSLGNKKVSIKGEIKKDDNEPNYLKLGN